MGVWAITSSKVSPDPPTTQPTTWNTPGYCDWHNTCKYMHDVCTNRASLKAVRENLSSCEGDEWVPESHTVLTNGGLQQANKFHRIFQSDFLKSGQVRTHLHLVASGTKRFHHCLAELYYYRYIVGLLSCICHLVAATLYTMYVLKVTKTFHHSYQPSPLSAEPLPLQHNTCTALTWNKTAMREPSLCLASPRKVPSCIDICEVREHLSKSCNTSQWFW